MEYQKIAILHYSTSPVIGGVEAVIQAHLQEFVKAGYSCSVIAGRGQVSALPSKVNFIKIPEIDSQHPEIIKLNQELENGRIPENFNVMEDQLVERLAPLLPNFDHLIIHNVFTKHFNLALTGALHRVLDQCFESNVIAWCHDFTWTSPSSRSKVYSGHPWDLLRTKRPDCQYVTVSKERQRTLAELFACLPNEIQVVYNGVDPAQMLGLSELGMKLVNYIGLLESDINLIMPVRVTRAKNIEFAFAVVVELKKMGVKPRLVLSGPPDPHDPQSMIYYQSLIELRKELGIVDEMRFIFESGPEPGRPFYIDEQLVGELYRIGDVMFMPSHREGFGMPVLEAGLIGLPVVSRAVPAAQELAEQEALIFDPEMDAPQVASRLIQMLERSASARLRRRVRQQYTWHAIFEKDIQPLLQGKLNNET